MYLAVFGLIVNVIVQGGVNSSFKKICAILGFLCSMSLYICIFLGELTTRRLTKKRRMALTEIGVTTVNEFVIGHWMTILVLSFNVPVSVAWGYVPIFMKL